MTYIDIERKDRGFTVAEYEKVSLFLDEKENVAVKTAADLFAKDWNAVCKAEILIDMNQAEPTESCSIIVGTIGVSKAIDELITEGKLDVSPLKDEKGGFHWEGYLITVMEEKLIIAGADRRGTIYGMYDFSENMGVSPWYFFADVPVKMKKRVCLREGFCKVDWPSVQYRGIFINDEEELEAWAKAHMEEDTIGPKTYRHIFELLLRLKANYIWPAMHVNSFNVNVENGKLADSMGMVVGTSHCDMLMRSNNKEWNVWLEKKGYEGVKYDYTIPGRNREILNEYWRESVEQNKDFEVCYTVGMRGVHDSGFMTEEIDKKDSSEEEKMQEKIELLSDIIKAQRGILSNTLGKAELTDTLQTFVPYKEVLYMYDHGLELPEDITVIWVDDNYGYMRRYPDEKDRKRIGGHGLYYHNSYWAHAGMSYLFINSIPLAHTKNELKKSYESGIRKIWVLNSGAMKPLEQELEFFVRYAWEAGKDEGTTSDVKEYLKLWINRTFSGDHGEEAAELLTDFAQITNVRKLEHMRYDLFSMTAYGDEGGRRLCEYKKLYDRAYHIWSELPEKEKEAFFQMVLMKIQAAYYINHSYYYADRSTLCYRQGKAQAADFYVERSRQMDEYKRAMLHYYNKVMADGKWDRIVTPESFAPPVTAMHPACTPALFIGEPGLGIVLWNEDLPSEEAVLGFSPYGVSKKWIEIFNRGSGSIAYSMEADEWIVIAETHGEVATEKRILVEIPDLEKQCGKQGMIKVHNRKDNSTKEILVRVESAICLEEGFVGSIEADGYVSIPADRYNRKRQWNGSNKDGDRLPAAVESRADHDDAGDSEYGWKRIEHIGRYEGNAMEGRRAVALATSESVLEYDVHITSSGAFLLELYRFPTLNSTGRIRLGVSVDQSEMITVETRSSDEWKDQWKENVMSNADKLYVTLPYLNAGTHTLRIHLIDHYVTFSKLVLYTKPYHKNFLGPQFSYHTEYGLTQKEDFPQPDDEQITQIVREVYRGNTTELEPRPTIYAGFNNRGKDSLRNTNLKVPLKHLGSKKSYQDENGRKDIIASFGKGAFQENAGKIALEAEYALENSEYAYRTNTSDAPEENWAHTNSETDGYTGLAMYIRKLGLRWTDPAQAPSMNFKVQVSQSGAYYVWMLVKFDDNETSSIAIGVDGQAQPFTDQYLGGNLWTYEAEQVWRWMLISKLELEEGERLLTLYAGASGLRVDRIYLSLGEELPPDDAAWEASTRKWMRIERPKVDNVNKLIFRK